jgi:hypothetical protein
LKLGGNYEVFANKENFDNEIIKRWIDKARKSDVSSKKKKKIKQST